MNIGLSLSSGTGHDKVTRKVWELNLIFRSRTVTWVDNYKKLKLNVSSYNDFFAEI